MLVSVDANFTLQQLPLPTYQPIIPFPKPHRKPYLPTKTYYHFTHRGCADTPAQPVNPKVHLEPTCILKFQPPSSLDYRACHGPQLIANARNSSISRISHQKSLIQNDNFSFIFCGTIRLYPDSGRAAVQAFFVEKFRFVYLLENHCSGLVSTGIRELSNGNLVWEPLTKY